MFFANENTTGPLSSSLQLLEQQKDSFKSSINYSVTYATRLYENYSATDIISFHYALKESFIAELSTSKVEIKIKQGEFFLAKPNTIYSLKNESNRLTGIISLSISKNQFATEYDGYLKNDSLLFDFFHSNTEQFAQPDFSNLSHHEHQLFIMLLDLQSSKDLYKQIDSQDFLALLMKYIILLLDHSFVANRIKFNSTDNIIKNYIRKNLKTANLTELANILNYTTSYTSELVTKTNGKPFKYMLREERLLKASDLLTNTAFSLDEIRETIGYDNLSSFIVAFKEVYGETPKNYRNRTSMLNLN